MAGVAGPNQKVKNMSAVAENIKPMPSAKQRLMDAEIAARRAADPRDLEIAEAFRHRGAVFLGMTERKSKQVRTPTASQWNKALKGFASRCGLEWNLANHQFRRKFANYAARSRFGDLRYLREHFKHWPWT